MARNYKILIACEFSGVVRDAFLRRGHSAISCDLRVHHASPGPDRWKERSRTLTGIADAFAEQWGRVLSEKVTKDSDSAKTKIHE